MEPTAEPAARASALDRLTIRLIGASGVSAVGDGLAEVALALAAVAYTSDARLVAGVYIAGKLPWLLLGRVLAGTVDRHRRPAELMLAADAARALMLVVTTVLVATGHANLALLYATAFVIGTGEILHSAAAQVLLPRIATGEALTRANGYIGAAFSGGYAIVGPAAGGLVYAAGRALPFAADAASFVVSGALLTPLRSVTVERDAADAAEADATPARRHIMANPLLRVLLFQLLGLAAGQAVTLAVLPVYGRRHLGLSSLAYGLLLGAAAIGNVTGAMLTPKLWAGRRATAPLLIGAGLFVGAPYVVMAVVKNTAVALAMLTIEALAVGVINTISPTLRMEHAPPAARARVMTAFRQILFISQPIAALVAGVVTERYGVTAAFALAGSVILVVVLATDRPLRRAVAAVGA